MLDNIKVGFCGLPITSHQKENDSVGYGTENNSLISHH